MRCGGECWKAQRQGFDESHWLAKNNRKACTHKPLAWAVLPLLSRSLLQYMPPRKPSTLGKGVAGERVPDGNKRGLKLPNLLCQQVEVTAGRQPNNIEFISVLPDNVQGLGPNAAGAAQH